MILLVLKTKMLRIKLDANYVLHELIEHFIDGGSFQVASFPFRKDIRNTRSLLFPHVCQQLWAINGGNIYVCVLRL